MATTFQRIYVPNLGSGIQIPTLPIGRGPSAMVDPGQGAVNVCHATDDVLPYAAPIRPIVSTAAESTKVFKNAPGTVFRISAAIGQTSGWLLLLDATTAPTVAGALASNPIDKMKISTNGDNGWGALEYAAVPAQCINGIVAVFSVDPNPLNYGIPPAGSLAWFTGFVQ